MIVVYRYRVKSLNGLLNKQARAVNYVWNFCNDTQKHALKWNKKWPSAYDLDKLTAGSYAELGLHTGTIGSVTAKYASSRSQIKKPFLRYRGKRSLGWVPLKGRDLKREGTSFRYAGNTFKVFNSRSLPDGAIKDGTCFACDALGNWYLNVVIEVANAEARPPVLGIGIDLGLKEFATLSNGQTVANPRFYRLHEDALGKAQRARKTIQARRISQRIKFARADHLHKLSLRLVKEFDYIAVGNISASNLAKTKMAKSVYDASWSSFRNMLRYKAITHGAWYEEVNEAFSTQTCSSCGVLPDSRPRGIAGLGIRAWVCSACGCEHDRDVNAAINILLRSGHRAPAEGAEAFALEMPKSMKDVTNLMGAKP